MEPCKDGKVSVDFGADLLIAAWTLIRGGFCIPFIKVSFSAVTLIHVSNSASSDGRVLPCRLAWYPCGRWARPCTAGIE